MSGLRISWETADNITVDNLTEVYNQLEADMICYKNGTRWLHEDDVKYNKKLMKAIDRVLTYYGKDTSTSRASEW